MKRFGTYIFLVASLCMISSAHANELCDPETGVLLSSSTDAPWNVQIQLNPEEIPINAPFDVVITLCSKEKKPPVRIDVDAVMPAHKHGMNYEPKTVQINHYRYEVKNLLFHMPGVWRLEITIFEKDKPHRFIHDVQLK